MASVRFTDVPSRPTECLDCTSLTFEEFQALVPPFEAAFQTHRAMGRLDGTPRTARQCTVKFIPIKPLVARGLDAPGSCAGHSPVPSQDHGHPVSRGGAGL